MYSLGISTACPAAVSISSASNGVVPSLNSASFADQLDKNDVDAVNGMVLMSPNERFTFDVKAIGIDVSNANDIPTLTNLAENQLQIVSQHSVFNRIVPVELV